MIKLELSNKTLIKNLENLQEDSGWGINYIVQRGLEEFIQQHLKEYEQDLTLSAIKHNAKKLGEHISEVVENFEQRYDVKCGLEYDGNKYKVEVKL